MSSAGDDPISPTEKAQQADRISPAEETRREGLAHAALDLKDEVGKLRLAVEQHGRRLSRAERRTGWSVAAATCLAVVVTVLAWVAVQQNQTAQRLDGIVNGNLCPIGALFVGSYDPSTRPLNPDGSYRGSAREKYDLAFTGPQGINDAYAALHCTTVVVPKRES